MNRYTVTSGQMVEHLETPFEASAEALALVALQSQFGRDPGPALGVLISVSGGQFGPADADGEMFMSSQKLLQKLGRWAQ